MGFSADQSMVLISKAMMDSLEGRRADINLEKMALMREQETLALSYNDAMSNTCFVAKNQDGDYEAVGPALNNNGDVTTSISSPNGTSYSNGLRIDYNGMSQAERNQRYQGVDGTKNFNEDLKNGVIGIEKKDSAGNWQTADMGGVAGISESYYTADDAGAKADYDAAMAKIRTKETKLDMDLEQVETQYQAIKTQYESARQLVNQRAQGDFKFFQG